MKNILRPFILSLCLAATSYAVPVTFQTADGQTLANVEIRGFDAYALTVETDSGVVHVPLEKLPPEMQRLYGFEPEKAQAARLQALNAAANRDLVAQSEARAEAAQLAKDEAKAPADAKSAKEAALKKRAKELAEENFAAVFRNWQGNARQESAFGTSDKAVLRGRPTKEGLALDYERQLRAGKIQ